MPENKINNRRRKQQNNKTKQRKEEEETTTTTTTFLLMLLCSSSAHRMAHFFVRLKRRERQWQRRWGATLSSTPERVQLLLEIESSFICSSCPFFSLQHRTFMIMMCTDAYPTVAAVYIICSMMFSIEWRECVQTGASLHNVSPRREKETIHHRVGERRDEVKEATTTTTDGKFFSTFHQPNLSFLFPHASLFYRHISNTVTIILLFCFCLFWELHVEGNNSVLSWITANLFHFPFLTFVSVAQLSTIF